MSAVIRAVTFDCWGTLISDKGFEKAMARRVDAIADALECDPERASELLDAGWRVHHNEWMNTRQYGSEGIARFCVSEAGVDDDEVCARLIAALEEAGRLGTQHALEGAAATLVLLRRSGIRTALVCDAGFTPGRIVREFLAEHGLLEHLEYCVFSNEIGVPKPDPRAFMTALDELGVAPGEAVHVGDLLRTDIYGARAVGMKTIRITQSGDDLTAGTSWEGSAAPYGEADEVVAHHHEMPDAFRRLGTPI